MKLSSYKNRLILQQFEALLHRILKDCYISLGHFEYEDYLQELKLKLLLLAQDFDGDVLGVDRFRFVAFARRGLTWYLIDLKRRQARLTVKTLEDINRVVEDTDNQSVGSLSQAHLVAFMNQARQRLDIEEVALFDLLCQDAYGIQELADIFQCSRQTIYQRRKRIAKKLADLKETLSSRP